MMLLDELIQMMIGMTDDQLRKIKNFILMKLSIKDLTDTKDNFVTSCPICKSNHDGKVTLQDIVEADETFFPVSYREQSL